MKKRTLFIALLVVMLLTGLLVSYALAQGPGTAVETEESAPNKAEKELNAKEQGIEYVAPTRAVIEGYEHQYEWVGSQAIPDNTCPVSTTLTLNVPDSFTINDLRVGFNAAHTWRSDVQLWVRSPAGTLVQLLNGTAGSSADNFDVLFEDGGGPVDTTNHNIAAPYYENSWAPVGSLATFATEDAAGDWLLHVCDDTGGDTGTVYRWALFFNYFESPNFSASYKTAPATVVMGDPFTYTVHMINTGDAEADDAWMTDTIPAGTAYVDASVGCSTGTCAYVAASDMITWAGSVDIGETVVVTFSVDTSGAACGDTIVNTAVISDPSALGTSLASASTQVVYELPWLDQGFEDPAFPPAGWATAIITDTGTDPAWTRETAGTYPTIAPHSGAAMAKFNSFNAPAGGAALLSTPVLDLSDPNLPPLSFWMSHDTGYATNDDRIVIWVSDDGWATHHVVGDPVSRYDAACGTPCWKQHTVDLTGYMSPTIQIGFLGVSAFGNNFYMDDVRIANAWYPCPEVSIGPDQAAVTCAGNMLEYTLEVNNNYPMADTIDLSLAGNAWPTSLSDTALALAPGGSAMVSVTVQVPWTVDAGEYDIATVTATGQGSGLSDTAQIQSYAQLGSGWEDLAPSPYGARYLAVVYDDGHLYQIGGNDASGYYSGTFAYDIAANTWMTMTSMITPVYYMDGAAIDGNIYIPGGQAAAASWNDFVQVYSTTADIWSTVAPMPVPLRYHEVVAYDGLLYVLGGQTTGSVYTNTVQIYDPNADAWSFGTPMTIPVGYAASGVIGGKIYLAGGYNGAYQTALQIYDPATDSWSYGAPMPFGWVQAADGVKHDRYLILAGGYYDALATASNYAWFYDAVTDAWTQLPVVGSLRYGAEGDSDGSEFYYVAGREYDGSWFFSNRNEHMIQCPEVMPDITVHPPALETALCPEETDVLTFTICNTGTAELDWTTRELEPAAKFVSTASFVAETSGKMVNVPALDRAAASVRGTPSVSANPDAVLWDQPSDLVGAPASQYFPDFSAGLWSADDFENTDWWSIESIYVPGSLWNGNPQGDLYNAYTLNWFIYADAGNTPPPGTYPDDGSGADVWSLSLTPLDPAVTIGGANDEATLDVIAAQGTPLLLPPGHYWLAFFPALDFIPHGQFGWQTSGTTNLASAHFADPDGLIAPLDWTPWGDAISPAYYDAAFRLEGEAGWPIDIPWMSVVPDHGTVAVAQCTTVEVTLDATSLAPGEYLAGLAIDSNDPDMPVVTLPVTFTVWAPAAAADFDWMPITPTVGATVSFTGTASGQEPIAFDWDFDDGSIGAGDTITHTFTAAGEYDVVMMATNTCGYDVVTYTVTVELGVRYVYLPLIYRNYDAP